MGISNYLKIRDFPQEIFDKWEHEGCLSQDGRRIGPDACFAAKVKKEFPVAVLGRIELNDFVSPKVQIPDFGCGENAPAPYYGLECWTKLP